MHFMHLRKFIPRSVALAVSHEPSSYSTHTHSLIHSLVRSPIHPTISPSLWDQLFSYFTLTALLNCDSGKVRLSEIHRHAMCLHNWYFVRCACGVRCTIYNRTIAVAILFCCCCRSLLCMYVTSIGGWCTFIGLLSDDLHQMGWSMLFA